MMDNLCSLANTIPDVVCDVAGTGVSRRGVRYGGHTDITNEWYIDWELLVKVVKYRHAQMFALLNKPVDKSEQLYICPTVACPNQ